MRSPITAQTDLLVDSRYQTKSLIELESVSRQLDISPVKRPSRQTHRVERGKVQEEELDSCRAAGERGPVGEAG